MMKHIKMTAMLLMSCAAMFGQTPSEEKSYLPNITPPSPVSYELGKYGNVPIGLFNGSTNINVPIYSYRTQNIEVPINMFYANNGIKVDNVSGIVGLGWNINIGGVITRTIKDQKDDSGRLYPNERVFSEGLNPEKYEFYQKLGGGNTDSEPDLFSFNFNGNSGQFIYNKEGEILMLKDSKIKIEYLNIENEYGFIVTTQDGVKYYFFGKELTNRRNDGGGHSLPDYAITSWFLSKIVHPKGDEVYFTYQNYDYEYVNSQSQYMTYPVEYFNGNAGCDVPATPTYPVMGNISNDYLEVFTKRVTKISSNNLENGVVTFTYSLDDTDITGLRKLTNISAKDRLDTEVEKVDFIYETTLNKRTFLNQITFSDPTKKYSFEYINKESFPLRLSLSQDLWGYYNGKSNNSLIPSGIKNYGLENINYGGSNKDPDGVYAEKGLLSKIIYPTKGYTKLEYEPNDYYGNQVVYPSLTQTRLQITTPPYTGEAAQQIITSPINQNVKLIGKGFFNTACSPGMNTGSHHKGLFWVINMQNNKAVDLFKYDSSGYPNSIGTSHELSSALSTFYFKAEAGVSYKLMLEPQFTCTDTYCDIIYYSTSPSTVLTNIITGGTRVKKMTDYDFNNDVKNQKRYYYAASVDNLTQSSGNLFRRNPLYFDIKTKRYSCNGVVTFVEQKQGLITSSSMISMFDDDGSNVHYSKVLESFGGNNFENGGIEHNFKISKPLEGNLLMGTDIYSCTTTNNNWDNGNEFSTIVYSKTGNGLKKVNEKIYTYILDGRNTKKETVFSARKNFDLIESGNTVYYCAGGDLGKRYFDSYACSTQHNHNLWMPSGKCIAPGNNNIFQYTYSPCYSSNVGDPVYYLSNISNLSVKTYEVRSNWSYLENIREIQYDINGLNPIEVTKKYFYDNTNHLQLTSQTSTTSVSNELVEVKYQYAHERSNTPMINAGMTGIPLKTETFKSGNMISSEETKYEQTTQTNDLILPTQVFARKDNQQSEELKVSYNSYDSKGNMTQYTIENGITVSIIWGYNKTKAIAKVENASLSQIAAALGTDLNGLNNFDETNLSAIDGLRNTLPNAMVSTYTHKPLVGLSSVTDPKGQKTTYIYDQFNRLKQVKDHNGNVISENQYNYRP